MKFSVIYDYEVEHEVSVAPLRPHRHDLWELTEYNCDISRCTDDDTTKQRKWCALLTQAQFEAWIKRMPCYFGADGIETLGSLGAPGFSGDWAPAISWQAPDLYYDIPGAIHLCAYVTPIPEVHNWPDDKGFDERNWERIRKVILHRYGLPQ